MSEILIKNMALPKQGIKRLILLPDGEVREICGDEAVRATDSRAVELPPHGRLIDADELEGYYNDLEADNGIYKEDAGETAETIANAPTILEASK